MTPAVGSSTAVDYGSSPKPESDSDTAFMTVGPEQADKPADTLVTVSKWHDWALATFLEKPHNRIAFFGHKAGVPSLASFSALSPYENAGPGHQTGGSLWEASYIVPVLVDADSSVSDSPAPVTEATTKFDDRESNLREQLLGTFNALFDQAGDEVFHDGIESDFRLAVGHVIKACGDVAVHVLHTVIRSNQANIEVVEEALRRIGSVDDIRTHHSRLGVLLQELESANPRIRDAASIGIAEIDDPFAIENVSRAIADETSEQLRRNLGSVLSQLQATRCHTS